MNDSKTTSPPGTHNDGVTRIEKSALTSSANASSEQEIGTFMKVLARLDPLGGRQFNNLVTASQRADAEKIHAPAKPRARGRSAGRTSR
jgi:hypothetical protein